MPTRPVEAPALSAKTGPAPSAFVRINLGAMSFVQLAQWAGIAWVPEMGGGRAALGTNCQCMSGWAMSLAACVVRRLKAELAKVGAAARQTD